MSELAGTDYEDWTDVADSVYFENCTCEHETEEHGWGRCKVKDCDCEGGFEE